MDIPAEKVAAGGGDKSGFGHCLRIGQVKLEDMAARFDVKSYCQGIVSIFYLLSQAVEIFHVQRSPGGDLISSAYTQSIQVIIFRLKRHQIAVDKAGAEL